MLGVPPADVTTSCVEGSARSAGSGSRPGAAQPLVLSATVGWPTPQAARQAARQVLAAVDLGVFVTQVVQALPRDTRQAVGAVRLR